MSPLITFITLSSIIENTIVLEENRNLLIVSTESTGKLFLILLDLILTCRFEENILFVRFNCFG